jgi:hypothetical protein
MSKFIEVTYLNIDNKQIKRLINTSHIFDVVPNPNNKGALIRFVPTSDYEKTYPVSFEAIEAYEEVKRLIQG